MMKSPWPALALAVLLFSHPQFILGSDLQPLPPSLESDEPQIALDRAELVVPAKKSFRPAQGMKLSLRLKVEKTTLRMGNPIRYSVELFNEGSETFTLIEDSGSFFKTGRLASETISLILAEGGVETSLRTKRDPHGIGSSGPPEGVSAAEAVDWLKARTRERKLIVRLAPGETLKTRGDAPGDPYRTLDTHSHLFGLAYELKAVLNAPNKPTSNTVKLRFR
jgi:hypothetical protein